jgi:hypothetical protein
VEVEVYKLEMLGVGDDGGCRWPGITLALHCLEPLSPHGALSRACISSVSMNNNDVHIFCMYRCMNEQKARNLDRHVMADA